MFRFTKQWEVVWNGHQIVVRNWWDILLRTGEELVVDNTPVQQEKSWGRMSRNLYGEIGADSEVHKVRVHIGSINWGLNTGCQIFVDDELIGGDMNKKFFT